MKNFITSLFIILLIIVSGCKKEQNITVGEPLNTEGVERVYYIAAEEVEWNYVPTGMNQITGVAFGST